MNELQADFAIGLGIPEELRRVRGKDRQLFEWWQAAQRYLSKGQGSGGQTRAGEQGS